MKPGEFVTSDTHFGHTNILHYTDRHKIWGTAKEMNEGLIRRWNEKVPPGAIIYHLGDFAFMRPGPLRKLISRLNGVIRFVKGNHDRPAWEVRDTFQWAATYTESKAPTGRKVVMSHYPFLEWNGAHKGAWHLHGHCHGNLGPTDQPRMDVGVDCHPNYEPFSYEEVKEWMADKKFTPVSHHRR